MTGMVGRDDHDVELVNVEEFRRLGFGGAGHARQLVVHAEVVLQGDGGEGLRLGLDSDAFLGLNRLVQAVGIPASRKDTAGELVDNHHFAVLDDILDILFVERVGPQELVNGMHLFRAFAVDPVDIVGASLALLG